MVKNTTLPSARRGIATGPRCRARLPGGNGVRQKLHDVEVASPSIAAVAMRFRVQIGRVDDFDGDGANPVNKEIAAVELEPPGN